MSVEIHVKGQITIPSDAKEELLEALVDYELDELEFLEFFETPGRTLNFDLDIHLDNAQALDFSEWLDDVMAEATSGQLYYWAENLEEGTYLLLESGGKETILRGPFTF